MQDLEKERERLQQKIKNNQKICCCEENYYLRNIKDILIMHHGQIDNENFPLSDGDLDPEIYTIVYQIENCPCKKDPNKIDTEVEAKNIIKTIQEIRWHNGEYEDEVKGIKNVLDNIIKKANEKT